MKGKIVKVKIKMVQYVQQHGISATARPTVRWWLTRHRAHGAADLQDRSRVPRVSSHKSPPAVASSRPRQDLSGAVLLLLSAGGARWAHQSGSLTGREGGGCAAGSRSYSGGKRGIAYGRRKLVEPLPDWKPDLVAVAVTV